MLGSRSDIKIRKGRLADAAAVAETFRQSWLQAYRGILPHHHLENMIRRRGADWWASVIRSGDSLIVLEKGGTIIGYATLGFSRTRGPYQGEIYELYILPEFQGIGLGTKLFAAARKRLAARGLRGLVVWVLEDNPNAVRFYESTGGVDSAESVEVFDHKALKKIAYTWH